MLLTRTFNALVFTSAVSFGVFLWLILSRNAPGLTALPALTVLGVAWAALYGWAARRAFVAAGQTDGLALRIACLLCAGALVYLFLDSAVWDYYQPLSLYDEVIAALAVTWLTLILALLLAVAGRRRCAAAFTMALVALLCVPLSTVAAWLNDPAPGPLVSQHGDVFVGGQGGYAVYRIPALLVLPAGTVLASGEQLTGDRLLAIAEARRDGALDTGDIDLVMKVSEDGGQHWSTQVVICRHRREGQRGKCGNATPVFDHLTGTVHLAYNLSGLDESPGRSRWHTAFIRSSADGGGRWSAPMQVGDDNLVFGPGHGLQKRRAPAAGRLLIPAYLEAQPLVLYSDDAGASWQRSDPVDTGNETEVTELPDGRLYLTTRHRARIGFAPEPNGRLFAISVDGGSRWSATQLDTGLLTPVCQASVHTAWSSGLVLFSNPAHPKSRVRMTLRVSDDEAQSWERTLSVYPGPAGYSVLGVDSAGDALVLYESGRLSYSERISLARFPAQSLTPQPPTPQR